MASANGPYSLRVTGVSKLDFGVKFATDPKTDYETANWQPVQGAGNIFNRRIIIFLIYNLYIV